MNLSDFFEHWGIEENPFRGEEARHDAVFARMAGLGAPGANGPTATHSDFDKIIGEIDRPSASVVFGEKGSGKTAIRMQIGDLVARRNSGKRTDRLMLVEYDDLNSSLERLHDTLGEKNASDSLEKIRLSDHLDAILARAVTELVDALLGSSSRAVRLDLGPDARKQARAMDKALKHDLRLLQAVYDRDPHAGDRGAKLRRLLRVSKPMGVALSKAAAVCGWLLPLAVVGFWIYKGMPDPDLAWYIAGGAALAVWLVALAKRFLWDRVVRNSLARRLRRHTRMVDRTDMGFADRLETLRRGQRSSEVLPLSDVDEHRYVLLAKLRAVLRHFGYSGLLVVIDRVDEPTLVNGDADRMRSIIWPMLNSKFLQQDGLGVKMLLPIELRYALFRESSAFFQEARLDKQNLVERLSWTGSMLYDLCDARIKACLKDGGEPVSLLDLFAEDVTRQDLIDALDQMHQPRDAFKFLYRCLGEHCSNVTKEQGEFRVPRLVLETVRKQESERVQQLYRGIRPG